VITARVDPHVHLLPAERTAGLMRWLHRALPGVAIPADITAEGALADLHAAGGHVMVNLLFPLAAGEAEELHRFGADLSAQDPGVIPVGGVHVDDPDPEAVVRSAIEDHGMRGLKLHPMVQRFPPGHPALEPAIAALAEYGLPLYVHTGFDDWYGWGYDLGELERIAERHPSIPLVLCHCAFPRLEWATEMARRHPQVWLDTTNVFGSIELAPAGKPRERLERNLAVAFEAAPDRIFFGTDFPAAMGSLEELHSQVAASPLVGPRQLAQLAGNAERFVRESFVIRARA
jgi:predicted TIM-barrel fold metal-dependent hydrolase